MVKFTSTVVAASLFAGSALAAPSFSRSDNVAVTAREIEAMFGREMVEYASRSPNHLKEVKEAVHTVNKITNAVSAANGNERREYGSPLVARQHGHGGEHNHSHNHPHNGQHPHGHGEHHPHGHGHGQHVAAPAPVDAPADASAAPAPDAGAAQRRSFDDYYGSFVARQNTGAAGDATAAPVDIPAQAPVAHQHPHAHQHLHQHPHGHVHPHAHLNGQHPHAHIHSHVHSQEAAPVAPVAAAAGPGPANQRRSYWEYSEFEARQNTGDAPAAVDPSAQAPVPHTHQHPHAHLHAHLHPHDHTHPHAHMHNGQHPHSHLHSHSASVPASPPTDAAAPAVAAPGRRSLDFDEFYARYADFDDLD